MSGSFRLGNLLGMPILVHYSWFFIFALVTLSLSGFYFPQTYPTWSPRLAWGVGVATSLLFFASVVAHELTHSLVSMRFGVPVKSITLFIFGGVARIRREPIRPREEMGSAVERMDSQDINQFPVVEGGRLLGIVARDSILRFIRVHSELRI